MRGDRKGTEGKVTKVDQKARRIFIEGITREKVTGTAVQIPIHPSKVTITGLNLDDKWRRKSIKAEAPAEKTEKPKEKPSETEEKPAAQKKERKTRKPRASTAKKTKKAETKKDEGTESG